MILPNKDAVLGSMDSKFFLGSGTSHSAYQIPGHPDFVVVSKSNNADHSAETVESVEDRFPGYNFGQAVAKLGPDIRVCKRQYGTVPVVTAFHAGKPAFLPDAPGASGEFNAWTSAAYCGSRNVRSGEG